MNATKTTPTVPVLRAPSPAGVALAHRGFIRTMQARAQVMAGLERMIDTPTPSDRAGVSAREVEAVRRNLRRRERSGASRYDTFDRTHDLPDGAEALVQVFGELHAAHDALLMCDDVADLSAVFKDLSHLIAERFIPAAQCIGRRLPEPLRAEAQAEAIRRVAGTLAHLDAMRCEFGSMEVEAARMQVMAGTVGAAVLAVAALFHWLAELAVQITAADPVSVELHRRAGLAQKLLSDAMHRHINLMMRCVFVELMWTPELAEVADTILAGAWEDAVFTRACAG